MIYDLSSLLVRIRLDCLMDIKQCSFNSKFKRSISLKILSQNHFVFDVNFFHLCSQSFNFLFFNFNLQYSLFLSVVFRLHLKKIQIIYSNIIFNRPSIFFNSFLLIIIILDFLEKKYTI